VRRARPHQPAGREPIGRRQRQYGQQRRGDHQLHPL